MKRKQCLNSNDSRKVEKFDEKLGNLEQETSLLKAQFVQMNDSEQGERSNEDQQRKSLGHKKKKIIG